MFYRTIRSMVRAFFRIYFRWEVYGSHYLPPIGGIVLASNHVSYLDPPLMGCAVDRPVRFMAKKELFDIPVLGPIIRRLGAFPVRRGGNDRQAIRQALEILRSGGVLGIFPEGTRGEGKVLLDPQPGAVLLATRAAVPIVPMAIVGAESVFPPGARFPRRVKVKIFIGEPIRLPGKDGTVPRELLDEYSELLMQRIDELRSHDMAQV